LILSLVDDVGRLALPLNLLLLTETVARVVIHAFRSTPKTVRQSFDPSRFALAHLSGAISWPSNSQTRLEHRFARAIGGVSPADQAGTFLHARCFMPLSIGNLPF
jgi:hypothetical protein